MTLDGRTTYAWGGGVKSILDPDAKWTKPHPDVLAAITRITDANMEAKGLTDSVRKVKGYLGGIMRYAVVEGMCSADLTRDIGDGLRPLPPGKNRPSIPFDRLPEFFRDMARPHEDAELTRIAEEARA